MNVLAFPKGKPMARGSERVEMSHGAGGRAMQRLIADVFHAAFDNAELARGEDQAVLPVAAGRIAMSTDTFVISPLFFPGGDIGALAVNGTVNDVAMSGATPLWLSAGFIIEEGFAIDDLKRIAQSMARAAKAAGVTIVTGDTKVVERGKGDGVFINTAGVGIGAPDIPLGAARIEAGDAILVSGTVGDHGVAIMAHRAGLQFETTIESDCAPLNGLIAALMASGARVKALRDPTRGGLSATLNEFAQAASLGIGIIEEAIPVRAEVFGACELLGLDPINVANEGKLVAVVDARDADAALAAMRAHPLGQEAAIIGTAHADPHHFVTMRTRIGGQRMIDWLSGDPLPRIC
ncbi:MAG: hydrogenase expression/formation protein HypE [Rhizobiaceae bacterium]|jgi:hydrogenase expression/formation protein HypE|nr:hydrogenase expression/formation protein HypE [Rhizobiaceae bacterium]